MEAEDDGYDDEEEDAIIDFTSLPFSQNETEEVSGGITILCRFFLGISMKFFAVFRILQMKPTQKRSSLKLFVGWNGWVIGMLMEVQIFPSKWPFIEISVYIYVYYMSSAFF